MSRPLFLIPRNIAIKAYRIPSDVRQPIDGIRCWVEHKAYDPEVIVHRFGNQLCFPSFPNRYGVHSGSQPTARSQDGGAVPEAVGGPVFVYGRTMRKDSVAPLQAGDSGEFGRCRCLPAAGIAQPLHGSYQRGEFSAESDFPALPCSASQASEHSECTPATISPRVQIRKGVVMRDVRHLG